jgi:hypothetical protein
LALTHKKLGITKELMATKILPFLMPLSIENGLTLNQFNALMTVIKEMVSRVEGEHRTKLEQLNSIQQESKYVSVMTMLGLYSPRVCCQIPISSCKLNVPSMNVAPTGRGTVRGHIQCLKVVCMKKMKWQGNKSI